MKTLMRNALILAVIVLVGVLMYQVVLANSYTKSASTVTREGWGSWQRFSHTFVTRTDTVTMPFVVPKPAVGDTILFTMNFGFGKTSDSINVTYFLYWSSDNSNWAGGNTIVNDSSVGTRTGYLVSTKTFGYNYNGSAGPGWQPYFKIVAIGNQPAGGKANEVGNTLRVDLLER